MSSYVQSFSASLPEIRQKANEYLQNLPENMGKKSAESFLCGFVVTSVCTTSIGLGCVSGALSALAVVVNTVATPLFKNLAEKIFKAEGETYEMNFRQRFVKDFVVMSSIANVAKVLFGVQVNVLYSLMLGLFLNSEESSSTESPMQVFV